MVALMAAATVYIFKLRGCHAASLCMCILRLCACVFFVCLCVCVRVLSFRSLIRDLVVTTRVF